MKITVLLLILTIQQNACNIEEKIEETYRQLDKLYGQKRLTKRQQPIWTEATEQEYDFIIVGAGSSGSVLANRLSENKDWQILLLEAGKPENWAAQIPFLAMALSQTHYNWNYTAEHQPNLFDGMNGQRMLWPRGKALGGTSVINYMVYTRGSKWDYDRWAKSGCPGWSYQEVLPYFMKSENCNLKKFNRKYHGTGGYLNVQDAYQTKMVENFVKSGMEMGLKFFDYSGKQSIGVSTIQGTLKNGERHSVAKAFLQPVRQRKNLHILTSAFVTQVLLDPNGRAFGVEYYKNGNKFVVKARKEIILSAGTFNSPKLLMLAGIGPKNHLEQIGIPVLKDLAVGRNLHDHLTFPGLSFLVQNNSGATLLQVMEYENIKEWYLNGTGPLTSIGGIEGIGYIKTKVSQESGTVPDVELLFIGGSLSTDYGLFSRKWMNINDEVYNAVFAPTHGLPTTTMFPVLLHPKSIGFLELNSRNPFDPPKLFGNYFSDPENHDLKTLLEGVRFIEKMMSSQVWQQFGTTLNQNQMPGCKEYQFDSDEYWKCAIRSISVSLHHQVGTTKMGNVNDPTTVVDPRLRVHGTKGLRVADCSVIPFAIGAHTNAPAIMVGEKAADIIKADYGFSN